MSLLPVNVTNNQEGVKASTNQVCLVSRGVSAQHGRGVEIVTVRPEVLSVLTGVDEERGAPAPAYMVRGHKKGVKILK